MSTDTETGADAGTMRLEVDREVCQGHTLCAMTAANLFVLDEMDGHSQPAPGGVPAGQEDLAREAVRSCPEQAIRIA